MRISDWSSDVCSSDLHDLPGRRRPFHASLTEGRTMPQPFRNRVALVTGGASGIGQAIVRRLIADGARTVFTDIDETAGGRMDAEAGGAARFLRADATVEADAERSHAETRAPSTGRASCRERGGK